MAGKFRHPSRSAEWERPPHAPGLLRTQIVTAGKLVKDAPAFWQQYSKQSRRLVMPAPRHPRWQDWPDTGIHSAWVGHSTVLMKVNGVVILTDPVFSERCGVRVGPVTIGLKRLVEPALGVRHLPPVDLILLSHAHMDHFDLPSLRALESKRTTVVTARCTSDLLRVRRYRAVHELGWGERIRIGSLVIQGLQVNHWGARLRTDTHRGYNGYLIESDNRRVLFGGDTADTHEFRNLRSAGPIDLAIMPIGAYDPWIYAHCTPEQALRMSNEAGAEHLLPVHHRTFKLSREPFTEPIERFLTATGANTHRVLTRSIGDQASLQ